MASAARLQQALAMTHPDHPKSASLLTRADYEQYRAQLDELRRVRDRDLPELLRDARGFVASDAEEEIAQIREDHVFVEARIAHLEALLRDARVIADSEAPDVAFPGRVVDVEYTRDNGKLATYRIAGAGSGARPGVVSAGSPVGQALIGRARGDLVSVELPNGRAEQLRIVAVRRDDEGLAAA
jgi:transcription elongation factor GreA